MLDVPKSTQPGIKLLSVLGSAALEHKPRSAALATPILEVSATIEELTKQATKPKPKMPEALEVDLPEASKMAAPKPTPVASKPLTEYVGDFEWKNLVAHTKEHFTALYSLLSKCDHEVNGDELIIYCVNAFYKKKLDDAKYQPHLYESVKAVGGSTLSINTIPTRAPLKNSQAAAIADIMGGGIEVSPEAI